MKKLIIKFAVVMALTATTTASAVQFTPPNDPVGHVFTNNTNDGYAGGRGIVFEVASDTDIFSIGIFHDLTDILLSWALEIYNGPLLRSGSTQVTTNGLEWIDIEIVPLTLSSGNIYHLEFSHNGAGNQNFFYDNSNVAWDQDGFENLEGTQANNLSNSVVSRFRVNEQRNVPDAGSTAAILGLALLGLAGLRNRVGR